MDGDLIKCNVCCKWVCEACSDIAVAKLKPIMNKCKSLYFICKACNEMNQEYAVFEEVIAAEKTEAQIQFADNSDMVGSLESMFDKKITEMESKLEIIIESKLDKRMEAITTLNKNFKGQSIVTAETIAEGKTFSEVLKEPKETDLRKIMQGARNDERVEEREKERRSGHFIIHGLEENGDDDTIKVHDAKIIGNILEEVGVAVQPASITRLGKPNEERKKWTVKVVMTTNKDKEAIMEIWRD